MLSIRNEAVTFVVRDGLRVIGLKHLLFLCCLALPGFFEGAENNSLALYATAASAMISIRLAMRSHEQAELKVDAARQKALAAIRHRLGDDEAFRDLLRSAPVALKLSAEEEQDVLSEARYLAGRRALERRAGSAELSA